MKLHLPKSLLTAVLAAVAMAPAAWGLSYTTEGTREVTINTSSAYHGADLHYSINEDATQQEKILFNTKPSTFTTTFDLDYDAFAAVTQATDILYVNPVNGTIWGITASTSDTVNGRWNNDLAVTATQGANATIMSAEDLGKLVVDADNSDDTTNDKVVSDLKLTIKSGNPGVNLTKSVEENEESVDKTVYYLNGLTQGSKTFDSVKINKALITSMTVSDAASITYTNASNTWSKTFEGDKVTSITHTRIQLTGGTNGTANTNDKSIVVGGAGQLHLETWSRGNMLVDDNIYLAGSTHGDVANFGVIRISNDDTDNHYTTEFSGNIYLVEDSSIKGTGSEAITFSGTITDKNVPANNDTTANGNYTLTLGGGGITVSGKVDVGGLAIVQGYSSGNSNFAGTTTLSSTNARVGKLSVGTNATLTVTGNLSIGSGVDNDGSVDISTGRLVFDNVDEEHYKLATGGTYYNTTGDTKTAGNNGYYSNNKLILIGGTVISTNQTSITGTGLVSWENVANEGIVGSINDSTIDTSTFYITSGTVRLSKSVASSDGVIYSDNTAATYVVKSGATLDAYFASGHNNFNSEVALCGKAIQLESGAKLTNTGSAGSSKSWQLLHTIELTGDAVLEATSDNAYGYLTSNKGDSYLHLNGHTLEKKGAGEFWLLNTTVNAGTIKITEGTIRVDDKNSNASVASIVMNGSTANLNVQSGKELSVNTLSGTGNINGEGKVVASTLQLNGTLNLSKGQIKANNMTVGNGGKLNMSTGTVLDLTAKNSGGLHGNGDNNILTDLVNLANSTTTQGTSYVLMTGTSVTNETADTVGNVNMRQNLTLGSNVTFTNNLNINGRGWDNTNSPEGYEFTVNNGASLKVGATGTGQLALITQADLIINNASVTAGVVKLGHKDGTASDPYEGTISMTHQDSKLTVEKIQFQGSNAANKLTMSAGTLEFTGEGEVITSATKNNVLATGAVSITGGEVVVKKDQSMTIATNRTISLSNMAFNIAADKTMALGEGVTTSGEITTKGNGTLRFKGAAAMNKATLDAGSKAVFEKGLTASELSLGESAMLVATTVSELTLTAGAGSAVIKTSDLPTTLTSVTVTDSATLQAGGSATGLGTSLTMSDGSTLEINGTGGVVLGGALTLGSEITLGSSLVDEIAKLTEGDSLVLFTEVTGLSYSGQTVALMSTEVAPVDAATVFNGLNTGVYEIAFAQDSVSINMLSIPEPTSSMLGLVGLVALTFRRRRK